MFVANTEKMSMQHINLYLIFRTKRRKPLTAIGMFFIFLISLHFYFCILLSNGYSQLYNGIESIGFSKILLLQKRCHALSTYDYFNRHDCSTFTTEFFQSR